MERDLRVVSRGSGTVRLRVGYYKMDAYTMKSRYYNLQGLIQGFRVQ